MNIFGAILFYISGNETMDPSKAHLHVSNVARVRKPVNKGACYVNQKHRGKHRALLFDNKCPGFFYIHFFNQFASDTV